LWVVGCGLWVVGCGLWVVGCGLRVVGCGLWVMGCGLWIVVCGLKLRVRGTEIVLPHTNNFQTHPTHKSARKFKIATTHKGVISLAKLQQQRSHRHDLAFQLSEG
jgi:hypothetical protein